MGKEWTPGKINQLLASQNTVKDNSELSAKNGQLHMWINILEHPKSECPGRESSRQQPQSSSSTKSNQGHCYEVGQITGEIQVPVAEGVGR